MEPSPRRGADAKGRSAWLCAAVLASGLTCACGVYRRAAPEPGSSIPLPALTTQEILAPIHGDGRRELDRLGRLPATPSVQLRRSHVLVSSGGEARAIALLNQLLFGTTTHTPEVRAFALFVRSRAYEGLGDRERSQYDLECAAKLAAAPDLQRVIDVAAGSAVEDKPAPATSSFEVHGRATWRASPPIRKRLDPLGKPWRVTVHHSAVLVRSTTRAGAIASLRAIQKSHVSGNGWADIAYHYLIDRAGRIWKGRSLRWQGAHAGDPVRNKGNIGVCLLGSFIGGRQGQNPSSTQLGALRHLLTGICAEHSIPANQIITHREIRATACPGARLQAAVEQMRRELGAATAVASR